MGGCCSSSAANDAVKGATPTAAEPADAPVEPKRKVSIEAGVHPERQSERHSRAERESESTTSDIELEGLANELSEPEPSDPSGPRPRLGERANSQPLNVITDVADLPLCTSARTPIKKNSTLCKIWRSNWKFKCTLYFSSRN